MTTLLTDGRDIWELVLANGEKHRRGCGHAKRIEVYEEPGQMSRVPWFAVYAFGDHIIARVNAAHVVEVQYS